MQKEKMKCSIREAAQLLREHGFSCSESTLGKEIAQGLHPWGKVIRTGPSGRNTLQIYRRDLMDWISRMSEVS